jgi:uncharacterized protein (DUF1501 family)
MRVGLSRRRFLKGAALATAALNVQLDAPGVFAATNTPRTLVAIQLDGGNDGLAMIPPLDSSEYHSLRPGLAVSSAEALPLSDGNGLHPAMKRLHELFVRRHVAIVMNAGFPGQTRSHFATTAWWQAGRSGTDRGSSGWLGRFLESLRDPGDLCGVSIGRGGVSPALWSARVPALGIESLDALRLRVDSDHPADVVPLTKALAAMYPAADTDFVHAVGRSATRIGTQVDTLCRFQSTAAYPHTEFGDKLRTVARIVAANVGTRVCHVSLRGFDTHASQKETHRALLADLSDGIGALMDDLERLHLTRAVTLLVYSEFGRRVAENGSGGTDHGLAGPVLVIGGAVRGGVVGETPKLTKLVDGDLPIAIDARTAYAALLDWMGADPEKILEHSFVPIPLLA